MNVNLLKKTYLTFFAVLFFGFVVFGAFAENASVNSSVSLTMQPIVAVASVGVTNNTIVNSTAGSASGSVFDNETIVNETVSMNETEVSENVTSEIPETVEIPENESSLNITNRDMLMLSTHLGTEIRVLQLRESLIKKIAYSQNIINLINKKYPHVPTDNLSSIVVQMQSLLEKLNNFNYNASTNETVTLFVSYKDEAIGLVAEFRKVVHALLAPEQLSEIAKTNYKRVQNQKLARLRMQIEANIRTYDMERLHRIAEIMGVSNSSLEKNFRGHNVTRERVKKLLQDRIKAANKKRRKEIADSLRYQLNKAKIEAKIRMDRAILNYRLRRRMMFNRARKKRMNGTNSSRRIEEHVIKQIENERRENNTRYHLNKTMKIDKDRLRNEIATHMRDMRIKHINRTHYIGENVAGRTYAGFREDNRMRYRNRTYYLGENVSVNKTVGFR